MSNSSLELLTKLLPFAHTLGIKYELRVLSHLVTRQLAAVNPDVPLEYAQWTSIFRSVEQMVGIDSQHSIQFLRIFIRYYN